MIADKQIARLQFIERVHKVTEEAFGVSTKHLTNIPALTEGLLIAELLPVDCYVDWNILVRGCVSLIQANLPGDASTIGNIERVVFEFFDRNADLAGCCDGECCGECKCGGFDEEDESAEEQEPEKEQQASTDESKAMLQFFVTPNSFYMDSDIDPDMPAEAVKFFNEIQSAIHAAVQGREEKKTDKADKKAAKKTKK